MSKAIPILSVLMAAALGGTIYFYIKSQDLTKELEGTNQEVSNLSKTIQEINDEKNGVIGERDKTQEKLKRSQNEYEKTLAQLQLEQQKKKDLEAKRDEMVKGLKDEIADQRVKITQLNGVIKVQMENKILFPSGAAVISDEGKAILKRVGSSFSRIKNKRIRVEGHTDNVPISNAKFRSNWELSSTRAANVLHVLIANSTIDAALYELVGLGEFHPVAENDTAENKALNRRIEILLLPKKKQ
jgi:chemotaxis protein MotB